MKYVTSSKGIQTVTYIYALCLKDVIVYV